MGSSLDVSKSWLEPEGSEILNGGFNFLPESRRIECYTYNVGETTHTADV